MTDTPHSPEPTRWDHGADAPDDETGINPEPMHAAPSQSRRRFLGFAAAGAVTAGGAAIALGRGEAAIAGVAGCGDGEGEVSFDGGGVEHEGVLVGACVLEALVVRLARAKSPGGPWVLDRVSEQIP